MITETEKKHNTPKWKRIYSSIKKSDLTPGSQFHTLSELCDKYEVSQITARRVFKRLKEDGVIVTAGRRGAIVQSQQSRMALLCLAEGFFQTSQRNIFNYELIQRLTDGLRDAGKEIFTDVHHVPLSFIDSNPEMLNNDIVLHSNSFNIVSSEGDPLGYNLDLLNRLRESSVRPILVAADDKDCFVGFPRIVRNIQQGFYEMTDFAAGRGHNRFAFLGYNSCGSEMMMRFNGFTEALRHRGISFSMDSLFTVARENFALEIEEKLQKIMTSRNRPTVLVCYNDQLALKVLEIAQKKGIKVPDDLAVTGCDDVSLCNLSSIGLTTISQNFYKCGVAVANLIKKRRVGSSIDNELVLVDFELKIRDSL